MPLKKNCLPFLVFFLIFNPLAAFASCSSGQVKRLDEKIQDLYIIARWKGGNYAKCKFFEKKSSENYYKCGTTLMLMKYNSDSSLAAFNKVVSKEGVIINTKTNFENPNRDWNLWYGILPDNRESTKKWVDSLTFLERDVFYYTEQISPDLPRSIEQRVVGDTYHKYKCLNVSF